MKNFINNTKSTGFTLMEVVIVAAVGLILGTLLISILVNSNGFFFKQRAIVNEGLSINDTMSDITGLIRQSSNVSSGYPQSGPTYVTGQDTLVLKLSALGTQGIIANTYDYAVIAKDSTNNSILRLKVFPDPQSKRKTEDRVLTTMLYSVAFSYKDKIGGTVAPSSASVVDTALTVVSKTSQVESKRTANSSVTLRNI